MESIPQPGNCPPDERRDLRLFQPDDLWGSSSAVSSGKDVFVAVGSSWPQGSTGTPLLPLPGLLAGMAVAWVGLALSIVLGYGNIEYLLLTLLVVFPIQHAAEMLS